MKTEFTPEQRSLLEEIWRISEGGWHAGWMADIEFELWRIIQTGPAKYGQLEIGSADIEKLKTLMRKADGWFYWDEVEEEKWIDANSWQEMYERRQNGFAH